ncbi:MAG TPA: tripartite tricarboxylate transporter TctB family protein [Bacillus sp. (in: firmicutes)]|nr:tripartite tricarboxylate transporter TctB family protein [Bacillus sp. (in: firmicutes)]
MRAIFSGVLLIFSICFTIYGFKYQYLTHTGQMGAGFFPRWIGFLLILCTAISFWKDIRLVLKDKSKDIAFTKTMVSLVGITALFIILFPIIGALPTMILYVFFVLLLLNSKKLVTNIIVSLVFPLGTYLLLETWLHAGIPKGFLGF